MIHCSTLCSVDPSCTAYRFVPNFQLCEFGIKNSLIKANSTTLANQVLDVYEDTKQTGKTIVLLF